MNAVSKVLILMVLVAIVVGAAVRIFNKDFTVASIYQSNRNYYPTVTDKSVFGR